jgi:hypothetical protein
MNDDDYDWERDVENCYFPEDEHLRLRRSVRGGGYWALEEFVFASNNEHDRPEVPYDGSGFRVVCRVRREQC